MAEDLQKRSCGTKLTVELCHLYMSASLQGCVKYWTAGLLNEFEYSGWFIDCVSTGKMFIKVSEFSDVICTDMHLHFMPFGS